MFEIVWMPFKTCSVLFSNVELMFCNARCRRQGHGTDDGDEDDGLLEAVEFEEELLELLGLLLVVEAVDEETVPAEQSK